MRKASSRLRRVAQLSSHFDGREVRTVLVLSFTVLSLCATLFTALSTLTNPEQLFAITPSALAQSPFEDDFESGSFSAWDGRKLTSGEGAAVVSTLPRRGVYNSIFTSNGGGDYENAFCYLNVSATELYARGYFYVHQSGIDSETERFFFLVFRASGSKGLAYAGWKRIDGVTRWCITTRDGTSYPDAFSTIPVTDRWYCVELHWKEDAVDGLAEMWVDGARLISSTGLNTSAYGDATQVQVGLPELYNCTSTTAYCDLLEIGNAYIGPKPFPSPPSLTAPINGATLAGSSATFTWTASAGATDYQIRLNGSSSSRTETVSTPSFVATGLSNDSYTWSVRAINGTGWSDWSPARGLTVAVPSQAAGDNIGWWFLLPVPLLSVAAILLLMRVHSSGTSLLRAVAVAIFYGVGAWFGLEAIVQAGFASFSVYQRLSLTVPTMIIAFVLAQYRFSRAEDRRFLELERRTASTRTAINLEATNPSVSDESPTILRDTASGTSAEAGIDTAGSGEVSTGSSSEAPEPLSIETMQHFDNSLSTLTNGYYEQGSGNKAIGSQHSVDLSEFPTEGLEQWAAEVEQKSENAELGETPVSREVETVGESSIADYSPLDHPESEKEVAQGTDEAAVSTEDRTADESSVPAYSNLDFVESMSSLDLEPERVADSEPDENYQPADVIPDVKPENIAEDHSSGGVAVLSDTYYVEGGFSHVVGEVRNEGIGNLARVTIAGTFYDSGNQVIATGYTTTEIDILEPKQKSPFQLNSFPSKDLPVDHYSTRVVSYNATDDEPYRDLDLEILSTTTVQSESYYNISGEVVNRGTRDAKTVKVVVTSYGMNGKITGRAYGFTDPWDIAPGKSAPFTVRVYRLSESAPVTHLCQVTTFTREPRKDVKSTELKEQEHGNASPATEPDPLLIDEQSDTSAIRKDSEEELSEASVTDTGNSYPAVDYVEKRRRWYEFARESGK